MTYRISFWKHHPVSDQNGNILAQETIQEQQKFNFDIVKLTPAGSWLATCYGVKDQWDNDFLGRRTITGRIINNVDDWLMLPLFTNIPPPLKEQLLAATLTCAAIKNKPVYATVFCPLTQALQCAGIDTLKEHWKTNKEKVLQGIKSISQNTIHAMQLFKKEGIRGMYFVTQSMQNDLFSPEEYSAIGKAFDAECLREASLLFEDVIFHIHGEKIYFCVEENIPKVQLHYGLSANNSSFHEMKKQTKYPVIPGIPANKIIAAKTKEEIKKIISEISEEEELSMLTCACVLPLDTRDEVIYNWKNFDGI